MRTIAIVNQKGGCGKTTTAINLAAVYARRNHRTLIVDMDPQAHCAAGLGVPEKQIEFSIGDAMLVDPSRFEPSALAWEVGHNLHLAPSTTRLAGLEAPGGGLHELPDRDRRLERVLERFRDRYDLCLIDCPPTIGLLTFNAMRAAREALIPVETGYFALKGAEKQWETIQRVIRRIGRPIACHILPTLFDPESQLAQDVLAALRRQFAGQILPMEIREHEALREAASMGQGVIEFAPGSEAHADYERLADWLDGHAVEPSVEIEIVPRELSPGLATNGDDPSLSDTTRMMPGPSLPSTASRAIELVERLRQPARTEPAEERESAGPEGVPIPHGAPVMAATRLRLLDEPAPIAAPPRHVFGVRVTGHGVLFVQPGDGAGTISLAGEFNTWNPQPLHHDAALGVKQALVPLTPGRYQYRLVVDGRWQPDPYNELTVMNPHGELNSIIVVPEPKAATK